MSQHIPLSRLIDLLNEEVHFSVLSRHVHLMYPECSLIHSGWGDPHDRKLYRKSVRNISRYETSLHRKKIGGIQKRERSIGVTLYVGSFAAI